MYPRVTIYRVEHKVDASGPYVGDYQIYYKFTNAHNDESHPSPRRETENDPKIETIRMSRDTNLHCAFQTIEQLKRWFSPEDRELLSMYGFHVAVYSVSQRSIVAHLPRQTVFKRTASRKLLRTISALEV